MNKKEIKKFFHISNLIEDVNDKKEDERMIYLFSVLDQPDVRVLLTFMYIIHKGLNHINDYCIKGQLRTYDVYVGGNMCLNPSVIKNELLPLFAIEPKTWEEIKAWHIKFESIHPFGDGNGRVGRFLMLIHLHKNGLPIPEMFLNEEEFPTNRREYYNWFK